MYFVSWVLTVGVALFIPRFMLAVLVGFALANLLIYYRQGVLRSADFKTPIASIIACVLAVLAFSCFYSLYPLESARLVAQTGGVALAAWLLYVTGTKYAPSALDEKTASWFQFIVLFGIAVLMSLMVALKFGGIRGPDHKFNAQAVSLALIYWPIIGAVWHYRYRWFVATSLIMAVTTIGLSASVMALVMIVVSGMVFGLMRMLGKSKLADIGVYSSFVAIIFTPLLFSYSTRLTQMIAPFIKQKHEHFQIWAQTWERIAVNWPWGIGVQMTRHDSQLMSEALFKKGQSVMHSHNMPLQLSWELGLLGVILAILCIGLLFQFYTRQAKPARPIAAAFLISLAIVYSISFSVWSTWRLSEVMLGLIYLIHSGQVHGERTETLAQS